MYLVGVLESRPALSTFLSGTLPEELRQQVELCPVGELPSGRTADLLVVSPDLAEKDVTPLLLPMRRTGG